MSLVLTQVEIILHCHYPSHNAMVPQYVTHMTNALSLFSMPLVLLGFISLYGSQGAPLLQAGVVLQGLIGAVTLIPPTQRPRTRHRYRLRPRTFTFVGTRSQSAARRDSYINDVYTRRRLMSAKSSQSWRNPAYCDNSPELNDCIGERPVILESSSRCNRNGVDILPEIPEESEENYDSDCSDIHEDASDVKFRDKTPQCGARSMDSRLDLYKVHAKVTDNCVDNKRWSIGTTEEIMSFSIENGLAKYWSVSENDDINKEDRRNNSCKNNFENVEVELDKQGVRERASLFPVNKAVWTTSLCEVGSNFDNEDVSEFDPLLSNMGTAKSRSAKNFYHIVRKARSMEDVPVSGITSATNQNDALNTDVVASNANSVSMHSSDEVSVHKYENGVTRHVDTIKLSCDSKHVQKRFSIGSSEQLLSADAVLLTEDAEVTDGDDCQKLYSTENGNCNQAVDHTGFSHRLIPNGSLTIVVPEDHRNVTVTEEICLSPDLGESEYSHWGAKLMSSETVVDSTSNSCLRRWNQCVASFCRVVQRLISCRTCYLCHCRVFRRRRASDLYDRFLCCVWEYVTIPYFFPSLLLRFATRLCLMGFAALCPSLAKKIIDECTNEEAAFSVSISGFAWLCLLLLSLWCSKMSHEKRKYVFAAGNLVAASGLYLLSKMESHDSLTLSCGIFGLGLGATVVMGNTIMHEALGTCNLAKVDVILDLACGILILVTGSVIDSILAHNEGPSGCFTLLAVVYLVTGLSWLLRPLVDRLQSKCRTHDLWFTTGGHHFTSG
ncbi:hypothetical protein L798_01192 [Zootermopsis nevadensis]|uniref:Uncharacterized protein n=2 Tax=Zootermopsis nevadensis TaxID=136037 RepID=A0A067RRD6_ZOONE|nr:hypothetical protein L798_01192 [Zootermopsis nevadensis]